MVLGQVERDLRVFVAEAVEAVLEDRGDRAVGDATDIESSLAGSLESLRRIAFAETHDAETGSVSVLGMGPILEDVTDHVRSLRSALGGPPDDTRRRPFEMLGMCLGSVRCVGRERALAVAPQVGGNASTVVEDLHGLGREAYLDLLANELIGHAVEVATDLDVIVDVHTCALSFGELVAGRRQRPEGWPVHSFEEGPTRALELLEGTIIECIEEPADLAIELPQAEEGVVTQRREDPAFDDLNARLDLGFVLSRQLLEVSSMKRGNSRSSIRSTRCSASVSSY